MIRPNDQQQFLKAFRNAFQEGLAVLGDRLENPDLLTQLLRLDTGYEWWTEINWSWIQPAFKYVSDLGPKDYSTYLSDSRRAASDLYESAEFQELRGLAEALPSARPFQSPPWATLIDQDPTGIYLQDVLISAIDRYVHEYGSEWEEEAFLAIYNPIEQFIFSESLSVDILIPVLGVLFPEDSTEIGSGVKIEKMGDDLHRARMALTDHRVRVDDVIRGAATHALVIEHREIINSSFLDFVNPYMDIDDDVTSTIDHFFASLRAVTGVITGYAQMLFRPNGWARRYLYTLPPIEGFAVRKYPGWWTEMETIFPLASDQQITREALATVGTVFASIPAALGRTKKEGRLNSIAISRLNDCLQRDRRDDQLIDAVIVLESLLLESSAELSYKFQIRLAALARLVDGNATPSRTVMDAAKSVYTSRSKLVHGSMSEVESEDLMHAIDFARMALTVLVLNPHLLNPKNVDLEFLLNDPDSVNFSPVRIALQSLGTPGSTGSTEWMKTVFRPQQ